MSVEIEVAREVTDELVDALNRLLPQLSSSAEVLTIDDVAALVNADATILFVARVDGAVVGTLTLVLFTIPTGARAWIEDVVVDAIARGRGVGAALTNAATAEAQRRGVRSVDLTSRPSRVEANQLYRKLGFRERDTNVYRYLANRKEPGK